MYYLCAIINKNNNKSKPHTQGYRCKNKMNTVKKVFNYIAGLNPKTNSVSSIGEYVSQSSQMVADALHRECMSHVVAESLAHKVLMGTDFGKYTTKQLWVISFELERHYA